MLERLTKEQIAAQKKHREQWIAYGLSTDPVDRPACEDAYRRCYAFDGQDPNVPIFWVLSPYAGISLATYLLRQKDPKAGPHSMFGGGFWAEWPAFERYFAEICNTDHKVDEGKAYADTCRLGHMWWPNSGFIVASERPALILRDAEGRLHADVGKAILYRDGAGMYAWHGTEYPAEWAEIPGALSAHVALTHENVEQRRVAAEMLGWDAILRELEPRVIDASEAHGTLLEAEIPDIGRERFLRVTCGTGREFVLCVPPDTRSAKAAQSWLHHDTRFVMPEART